ncbi:MAG: hypothetical protein U9R01_04710, partial [candidate division WOR-3 bacterium]|nr:hypothetical protein [candidate division WOR-3 bacterium]
MARKVYILFIALPFTVSLMASLGETPAGKCFQHRWHTVNRVDMPITNWGEFGQSNPRAAGTYWPRGSGEPYIYGAGLWIGAFVEKEYEDPVEQERHTFLFPGGNLPDTLIGDVLVSIGYNTVGVGFDFVPGPPDSEHIWDHWYNPLSHPEDRIYFSTDSVDMSEWPLTNDSGEPISAVFGKPDRWADEETWCEYNDLCNSIHREQTPFSTYPLGLAVRQITYGGNLPDLQDMLFLLYEFENVSDDTIRHMFVGNASDMDVGDADNDLLGIDVGRSLGWTSTLTQEIGWSSSPPYYVGVCLLQGPKADDTLHIYGLDGEGSVLLDTIIYPGEYIPLTSFQRCTRGYDADNELKRYMMLVGWDIMTGQPRPFSGIPDNIPGDKRMVMGCGPFELAPGEVDTFAIAVMFSNGNTGDLDYLKYEADFAHSMYEYDWAFPSPPPAPNVTVTPGDRKVTIVWDNSSEKFADPFYPIMRSPEAGDPVEDTLYREYDFEGFRLWRSRTGVEGDWEIIGQWDIKNDFTLLPGDVYIPGIGNASGEESDNEGLVYSYVDEDVINGVPYYYAVTAYDYNTPGDHANKNQDVWVSLESGFFAKTATPRAEPCDIVPMETDVSHTRGATNVVNIKEAVVETPIAVTGDVYKLVWGETFHTDANPVFSYKIYNETEGEWVTSTPLPVKVPTELRSYVNIEGVDVDEWFGTFTTPVFDGIRLSGEVIVDLSGIALADSIKVITGDYPADVLQIAD